MISRHLIKSTLLQNILTEARQLRGHHQGPQDRFVAYRPAKWLGFDSLPINERMRVSRTLEGMEKSGLIIRDGETRTISVALTAAGWSQAVSNELDAREAAATK